MEKIQWLQKSYWIRNGYWKKPSFRLLRLVGIFPAASVRVRHLREIFAKEVEVRVLNRYSFAGKGTRVLRQSTATSVLNFKQSRTGHLQSKAVFHRRNLINELNGLDCKRTAGVVRSGPGKITKQQDTSRSIPNPNNKMSVPYSRSRAPPAMPDVQKITIFAFDGITWCNTRKTQ